MPVEDALINVSRAAPSFFVVIGILVTVMIGINHSYPPEYSTISSQSAEFSVARAMRHVRRIAAEPHPTGSPENESVRNYLIEQLRQLGLQPVVQSMRFAALPKHPAGIVHNIVVKRPGRHPGKAVLLSAHYDSVPSGPGAADNGASVSAVLETLRVLSLTSSLENDVICLFTDGEEVGLVGAQAFVDKHPWAAEIGLVLNFEYRGNRGALMMFETSQDNGKLIEGLADAGSFVLANSLMYEVYRRLPNDTDFTVYKKAGIPGMNFAAIEGLAAYHSPFDRPDLLDQHTLQHQGEIMLRLVRYFGHSALDDLRAPDRIYFDMPGFGILHYPTGWTVPLNVLLLLGLLSALVCLIRRKSLSFKRVLAVTCFIFPLMLVGLPLTAHCLWLLMSAFHADSPSFVQKEAYLSLSNLCGFVMLNLGCYGSLQRVLKRWFQTYEMLAGILLIWMLLCFLSARWLPGGNFVFFWPLASMTVALAVLCFAHDTRVERAMPIVVFLGSVPGIVLFTVLIKSIYIALTPSMISVVIFFATLITGLLSLLSVVLELRGATRLCFLTGLTVLIVGTSV